MDRKYTYNIMKSPFIQGHALSSQSHNHTFENKPKYKKRRLYDCSADKRHRLTYQQASKSKWFCTHCGAPLIERGRRIKHLTEMAEQLQCIIVDNNQPSKDTK